MQTWTATITHQTHKNIEILLIKHYAKTDKLNINTRYQTN